MTMDEYIAGLRGKSICVIGMGVSNTPLISLLLDRGLSLTVCDKRKKEQLPLAAEFEKRGASLVFGEGYLDELDFDVIFRTPGLLPINPKLSGAKERGAVITSEMEAFFALCPCMTIAITGSDGKTTTSSIIAELLKGAGKRVHLGGNIGTPLFCSVPDMRPDDVAVLELSSFQLHGMACRPNVAVITNVSPNHLDIHPDFEDYVNAKRNIFLNQTRGDKLVLNLDNQITASMGKEAKSKVVWFSRREAIKNGVFCADDMIYASKNYEVKAIMPASEIMLPGVHNVENYMAAFAAVDELADIEVFRHIARTYTGVPHRLELIREKDGVKYYNDSIASSPTRTIAGLHSFEKKPILIAGGHDKHIPFDTLGNEIAQRVKALYLTGDTAEKIAAAVRQSVYYDPMSLPITILDGFKETVLAASAAAKEGDMVLLSPACSSFDKFDNFAERGNTFREIVNKL